MCVCMCVVLVFLNVLPHGRSISLHSERLGEKHSWRYTHVDAGVHACVREFLFAFYDPALHTGNSSPLKCFLISPHA